MGQVTEHRGELFDWQMPSHTKKQKFIWQKENSVGDVDVIIVPGVFSYGNAFRSGAIDRFSPIVEAVVRFANAGGPVPGCVYWFQILCESAVLPGWL